MPNPKRLKTMSARETFAANMRHRRIDCNFTQELLADECGLHRNYVGSVERGERNISIDNMEIIAAALSCSISDLLKEGNSDAP